MHKQRLYVAGDVDVVRPTPSGPANGSWKGDATGYSAVHKRLEAKFGKASSCICLCGAQAEHWAFDEPTGYSTNLARYTALCAHCHCVADRRVV